MSTKTTSVPAVTKPETVRASPEPYELTCDQCRERVRFSEAISTTLYGTAVILHPGCVQEFRDSQ